MGPAARPGRTCDGARLLLRLAAASGSQEPAGGVQGGFGRAGEDAALRQERALLPGAAPGRAAGVGAQLLGSPARAGAGPGPRPLRDSGDHGAQHAAQDTDQQGARRRRRGGTVPRAASQGAQVAGAAALREQQPEAALGGGDASHQRLPG